MAKTTYTVKGNEAINQQSPPPLILKKRKRGFKAVLKKSILPHAILMSVGFLFLVPFLWLFLTSLKTPDEIFAIPPKWLPSEWQWNNYTDANSSYSVFQVYLEYRCNLLIFCCRPIIIGTVGCLRLCKNEI